MVAPKIEFLITYTILEQTGYEARIEALESLVDQVSQIIQQFLGRRKSEIAGIKVFKIVSGELRVIRPFIPKLAEVPAEVYIGIADGGEFTKVSESAILKREEAAELGRLELLTLEEIAEVSDEKIGVECVYEFTVGEVTGIEKLIELSIGEEVFPACNVVSTFIYEGTVGVEGEKAFVKRRVVDFASIRNEVAFVREFSLGILVIERAISAVVEFASRRRLDERAVRAIDILASRRPLNERAVRALYIVAFWRRFAVRVVGGWLSVGVVSIGKRKVYDAAVAVDATAPNTATTTTARTDTIFRD